MKQGKVKTIEFLINRVQTRHPEFDSIPKFSLLLGAGCSKSSGIPTGWEIINTLKKLWFLDNFPKGNIHKLVITSTTKISLKKMPTYLNKRQLNKNYS